MTSSSADQQPQLMNGDEDPYKSEGHIELKIENFSGFVQEKMYSQRCSDPVYVRGVPWRISGVVRECNNSQQQQAGGNGQKQKCLGYYLECNDRSNDQSWSYSATAQLKLLAQKEGKIDNVYEMSTHIFNAKSNSWGPPKYMKFTRIMDPDNGWYDEQKDCITLAVDLIAHTTEGFREYVLVAENELKLDRVPTIFSMQIGQLEWEVNFDDRNDKRGKSLVLCCKDVAKASMGVDNNDKVLLELFGYRQQNNQESELLYSPISDKSAKAAHRHLLTSKDNSLTVKIPGGSCHSSLNTKFLFTIRVFKESSQFPDFTKEPAIMVGRIVTNVALRVGDQLFYVNKQLLAAHSLFFDRMFHGDYTAATQQEVELSLNTHSAELFHHFLLVMCVNEVFPNSMNVAALFKLADFYDAENVRHKCDQHLRMAREMPIEKRVMLARDHGSKGTQALIVDSANFEQLKTISLSLIQNRR